jgi:hypothetical protein
VSFTITKVSDPQIQAITGYRHDSSAPIRPAGEGSPEIGFIFYSADECGLHVEFWFGGFHGAFLRLELPVELSGGFHIPCEMKGGRHVELK